MPDTLPTAVVTGASRGFGRAIAAALVAAGHDVIGIARGEHDLRAVHAELGDAFTPIVGDATDEALAHEVLRDRRPGLLVLNAGSTAAHGADPRADLGDLQRQLAERHPACLHLDPGGPAGAVGAGQRGDRDVQRRRPRRIPAQRRIRQREGRRPLHARIRRG